MNNLKEISFIAIFSFLLMAFSWLAVIFEGSLPSVFDNETFQCHIIYCSSGVSAFSGVISIIHIKLAKRKGLWLAIPAIVLGLIGAASFHCC
jgi:hypothetical protein